MDFAQEQRKPGKHMIGFGVVILMHVALIYALLNGLGVKIVKLIQKPLEVKIVEEVKPPPPPELPPPPPPTLNAPPPPTFIPPVEVNVTPPPQAQNNAVVIPHTDAKPQQFAPPAPPQPTAPPAPPAKHYASSACPNWTSVKTDFAAKLGVLAEQENVAPGTKVEIEVEAKVGSDGMLTDPTITKSTNAIFNPLAKQLARRLKCTGGPELTVPIAFIVPED